MPALQKIEGNLITKNVVFNWNLKVNILLSVGVILLMHSYNQKIAILSRSVASMLFGW